MAEIIVSKTGIGRSNLELHIGAEGLVLASSAKQNTKEFASFAEVAAVEARRTGRKSGLRIVFLTSRPEWWLPSIRTAEAEWAARMISDRVSAAARRSEPAFAAKVRISQFPAAIKSFTGNALRAPVDIIDFLLMQGVIHGASDVHIEPYQKEIMVRFRIDGVLYDVVTIPRDLQDRLTARLKVISRLTVFRKDIPQEGRVALPLDGRTVDFRMTSLPTIHGEKFTARIFDPARELLSIQDLGMDFATSAAFAKMLSQPQGTVLLTGPANSGKTTTMYAALRYLREHRRNLTSIATVEDPVEYDLRVVNQTQVNQRSGLTFAAALKTVLRQDPEVIMVGEIRDSDTAEIAVQAGLTGHMILSTVHAKSAVGVLPRLIDLGVEPFLISSSVNAVIAQRLLRKACPDCRGKGCERCGSTGYSGRTGVFQLLPINEELKEMVIRREPLLEMEKAVERSGVPSLRDSAMKLVEAGVTTEEEVARVLGDFA